MLRNTKDIICFNFSRKKVSFGKPSCYNIAVIIITFKNTVQL